MKKLLNIEFEKAVRLLVRSMPVSHEGTRKPMLFHGIRVGVYLYERGYSRDIVLAGVLHDLLEDTEVTEQELTDAFGDNVSRLVRASTKDRSIENGSDRTEELIRRCIENGEDALIVKAADILDSFMYYSGEKDTDEIRYCLRNAEALFRGKPERFTDTIFMELKMWQERCAS